MRRKTKIRRNIDNLKPQEKWGILESYISLKTPLAKIGEEYNLSRPSVKHFVSRFANKFNNSRSIRLLMTDKMNSVEIIERVNPELMNEKFLSLTSKENEPLTQEEILFSELLLEYGDDITAIKRSNLDIGLVKDNRALYKEAMQMRAFYLKKKSNVREYITEARKRNLGLIEEGKEYVQQTLLEVVEQLKNSGDIKTTNSRLKAIELIGRTLGVFDDKLSVNHSNGDEALDRILEMANADK
jgi:hypothetical protein